MKKRVSICCEGPDCNGGHSASDREAAIAHGLPNATAEIRDEAEKHARGIVTKRLAVTPHRHIGVTFKAATIFQRWACNVCDFERVYGNGTA